MRQLFLVIPLLFQFACSTTVKDSDTKGAFDINIGCTDNMKRYKEERQSVVGDKKQETTEPVEFECPPEDKK